MSTHSVSRTCAYSCKDQSAGPHAPLISRITYTPFYGLKTFNRLRHRDKLSTVRLGWLSRSCLLPIASGKRTEITCINARIRRCRRQHHDHAHDRRSLVHGSSTNPPAGSWPCKQRRQQRMHLCILHGCSAALYCLYCTVLCCTVLFYVAEATRRASDHAYMMVLTNSWSTW